PRGLYLDHRPRARPHLRPERRGRHGLAQLPQRPRPAHAVRRREGVGTRARGRLPLDRLLHRPAGRAHHARRRPHPSLWSSMTSPTPPFDILRCAYAELVVTDLAASRAFYVDVLGLTVTKETEDAVYLRP